MIQGSEEWFNAKRGWLGASRVADAIARTKSGWGASRANLMADLIVERITGETQNNFTSAAMQWGLDNEASARAAYQFMTDASVEQTGFVPHPAIHMSGASPDGLIGSDGLLEMKCPLTATHIETLLGQSVPGKYVTQMQWQMACTGRQWCDFVSFDPRMPESMRIFIQRVPRDQSRITELEGLVRDFLSELDAKLAKLVERYERREAA